MLDPLLPPTSNEPIDTGVPLPPNNGLEKVKVKDNVYRDIEDFYYIYLNWAVVFLLAAFFFKNTFIGNILED